MKIRTTWIPTLALVLVPASLALASGGGEHHADSGVLLKDFIYRVIDFGIVAAVLVYFTRKPIRDGLKGRSEKIAADLAEAKRLKEEAEAKFAEYDTKLAKANEEIAGLSQAIKDEALQEHDRIVTEAAAAAAKIREEAGKSAEQEVARARAALRQEASELAITLAEELVSKSLTKEDQARLVDEYLQKVGELH